MRRFSRAFSALAMMLTVATMLAQGTVPPLAAPSAEKPVTVSVDLSKSECVYKPIYSWFGYDEANFTTMRD